MPSQSKFLLAISLKRPSNARFLESFLFSEKEAADISIVFSKTSTRSSMKQWKSYFF